ncbi:MAG: hypothetical protein HOY69_15660 [Streptomyces sp.]|nr:hypothetical protein [Streptomyces sp.]
MAGAVALGVAGLVFVAVGLRVALSRRGSSRAGWGAVGLGLGQLLHAAGTLAGHRQPLGLVLALSSAACAVAGALLVVADRAASRSRRRRLPPLRP